MTVPDHIERTVSIEAPRSVVWSLVSQPGWWINTAGDELIEAARAGRPAHRVDHREGRDVVVDEKLGEFPLIVESSDEPDRIVFRWAPWDLENLSAGSLVAFTLSGEPSGPTSVTVVESGMAAVDEDVRQSTFDEHAEGWRLEMDALVAAAEVSTTSR